MRRNQWAAGSLAILLFFVGVAVGALGHRYATGSVSAKSSEDYRQQYIAEMQSKLKLSPQQLTQLETILDETKAKYKAVRDSYRPAMLKVKQDQTTRVKAILTPQQVPAYEQLVAERERRAREQEERDHQRASKGRPSS